ncbi:MAG TPA: hypothetical protein VNM46_15245, partial [Xanthobacteraceae bacterium]|nr:hypothetical protein [Xanthobacteraceae bacterium]
RQVHSIGDDPDFHPDSPAFCIALGRCWTHQYRVGLIKRQIRDTARTFSLIFQKAVCPSSRCRRKIEMSPGVQS